MLIGFVTPEGEFLAFYSLCRLGWSFSGNPAWTAEILGFAACPAKIKAKSTVGYRVRIAYLFRAGTPQVRNGTRCVPYEDVYQPSLPPLKTAVLGAANGACHNIRKQITLRIYPVLSNALAFP